MRVKNSFLNSKSLEKYLFLFLMIGIYSCNREKPSDLVGVWEIDQLKINMKTYQNSDSTQVVEVSGKNWEEKMKVRNIQTYFNADGTYHSLHRNLQDSTIYDPAGTWKILGDSLIIQDTIPQRITYKFKFKVDKSVVEYWGTQDFDQDGKVDDEYYSKQLKIKQL